MTSTKHMPPVTVSSVLAYDASFSAGKAAATTDHLAQIAELREALATFAECGRYFEHLKIPESDWIALTTNSGYICQIRMRDFRRATLAASKGEA